MGKLSKVLSNTLKDGAEATELCVIDNETFFHTTSPAKLESILKKGLKTSNSGQNFATRAGGSKVGHIYVTNEVKEARFWARQIPNLMRESDAIILRVEIPKKSLTKLRPDAHFSESTPVNFEFEGNIKPEWIKSWTKMDLRNSNTPMKWRVLAKGKQKPRYVPSILDWVEPE
jgi:hypothetical protein